MKEDEVNKRQGRDGKSCLKGKESWEGEKTM